MPATGSPAANPDPSTAGSGGPGGRHHRRAVRPGRFQAVLFDFQGTLAQVEDPVEWVTAAARDCGASLDRARATGLADRLLLAGRAGGPPPARVPPHLAEVYADRDLYEHAHRAAYVGLAATVDAGIDGLPDALYARLLRPDGWRAYADTVATLRAVHEAGLPIGVVSNIGFDVRPLASTMGFHRYVDFYALSYELGRCKPDEGIFQAACAALRVPPERVLMIGDTTADAAAVRIGCTAYLVPAGPPGGRNGLAAVLDLTDGYHDPS